MWIKNVKLDNGDPDMIWVDNDPAWWKEHNGTAGENMHTTKPSTTGVPDMTFKGNYVTILQSEYNKLLEKAQMFDALKKIIDDDDSITVRFTTGPPSYEGNTW